jgi:hypothetical protein
MENTGYSTVIQWLTSLFRNITPKTRVFGVKFFHNGIYRSGAWIGTDPDEVVRMISKNYHAAKILKIVN